MSSRVAFCSSITTLLLVAEGEQGWRSGESTRLPLEQTRYVCLEFVVGSRPYSEKFYSGHSGFPLSSQTNIPKLEFDLDGVPN